MAACAFQVLASILHPASSRQIKQAAAANVPCATPAEALDSQAFVARLQPNVVDDWQATSRIETPAKKLARATELWPEDFAAPVAS